MNVPVVHYLTWWQIEKDFLGQIRWVHMDDWFNAQAERSYQQYVYEVGEGRRVVEPFEVTYTGNDRAGSVGFLFEFGDRGYWQTNLRTCERCKIRRIEYRVVGP